MELIYYSYYPYKDPNKVLVKDEDENDLWGQPFRLYKAARCHSLYFDSVEEFVNACYEAMDRPDVRIDGYRKCMSYKDDTYKVDVYPTKNFYGATNEKDGVFYVKDAERGMSRVFVMDMTGLHEKFSWYEAVLSVFKYRKEMYSAKLCDFTRDK